jgi:YVTN family beta-propeller protein
MQPLHPSDPARIGPFEIVARLGAGGMGQVYLGRDAHGRPAAVKVVHPGLASDQGFRYRFAREIATAQRVDSPWTAAVLTADPQARPPWLATAYIPGPSLDQVVETAGPLSESATTILASRLAHALAHLHAAGVVHRDLKPSNVLLAPDGPRLIDFGIARAADSTKITHTGAMVGTPAFMSPEQAGGEDAGAPSDVFSLAAVVTYAATGTGPFGRTTSPMAMLLRISDDEPDTAGLPEALRPHLEPCLAKHPDARPAAAALAAALDPLGRDAAQAAGLSAADPTVVDGRWQGPPRTPASPLFPESLVAAPPAAAPPARTRRHALALPLGVLTSLLAIAVVLALVLVTGGGRAPAATSAREQAAAPPPVAYPEPARPAGTGSQLGRVPVGNGPDDITVSPDGSRVYTVNYQDITVIDTASGTATATIGLSGAVAVAFTPDSSRAYLPLLSGFLSVVDTATSAQVAAVPIAESPQSATVSPDGRAVYIVHGERSGATSLSVVDTASNTVVATVPVTPPDPAQQYGHQMFVAAAPDSATVWVGGTTDSISVVDTAARAVVATFDVDGSDSIQFGAGRAFVLNRTDGITVFDVPNRTELGLIRPAGFVNALAAAPDGRFLYLASGFTGQPSVVRVLDAATTFLVHEIALDANPNRLAIAPDGRTLFVSATEADAVLVADTTPYA